MCNVSILCVSIDGHFALESQSKHRVPSCDYTVGRLNIIRHYCLIDGETLHIRETSSIFNYGVRDVWRDEAGACCCCCWSSLFQRLFSATFLLSLACRMAGRFQSIGDPSSRLAGWLSSSTESTPSPGMTDCLNPRSIYLWRTNLGIALLVGPHYLGPIYTDGVKGRLRELLLFFLPN